MRIFVALAATLLFAGCPGQPSPDGSPAERPAPQPTPAASPETSELKVVPPDSSDETPAATAQAADARQNVVSGSADASPDVTPELADASPGVAAKSAGAEPNSGPESADVTPGTSSDSASRSSNQTAESARTKISYEGLWTAADAQGQTFDIIMFPNGQAVTNWTKGTEGARGERGYWRQDGQRATVVYSDGSTDVIEPDDSGFRHRRYSAGSPLDSQPLAESEARRGEGSELALVGVWRLNKEPDGSHLYIALQSNGRAISTINGGTEGRWKANDKGALCEWPDGWVDQIERGNAGWQKRSWVGSESSAPADLSLATRVGETRFSVEP